MQMTNFDDATIEAWVREVRFQSIDTTIDDWATGAPFNLDVNPKTGWKAADYWLKDPTTKYRSSEYQVVENYGCFADDKCTDCNSTDESLVPCHSWVSFDISSSYQDSARLNLLKTVIVMLCFGVSIFVLTRDAELMVIGPIERMVTPPTGPRCVCVLWLY